MGACIESYNSKTVVETKIWEREGHAPDTSQPPDSHTVEEEDHPAFDISEPCNIPKQLCPPGNYRVVLAEVPIPEHEALTTVTWKHWYEVDPEIPHTKTNYAKETKTAQILRGPGRDLRVRRSEVAEPTEARPRPPPGLTNLLGNAPRPQRDPSTAHACRGPGSRGSAAWGASPGG